MSSLIYGTYSRFADRRNRFSWIYSLFYVLYGTEIAFLPKEIVKSLK